MQEAVHTGEERKTAVMRSVKVGFCSQWDYIDQLETLRMENENRCKNIRRDLISLVPLADLCA